jgi:hypothetical protein
VCVCVCVFVLMRGYKKSPPVRGENLFSERRTREKRYSERHDKSLFSPLGKLDPQ